MAIEFEPRIEKAIKEIQEKTGLPRWQIVLALEGSKDFKRRIPERVWKGTVREVEEDPKLVLAKLGLLPVECRKFIIDILLFWKDWEMLP